MNPKASGSRISYSSHILETLPNAMGGEGADGVPRFHEAEEACNRLPKDELAVA